MEIKKKHLTYFGSFQKATEIMKITNKTTGQTIAHVIFQNQFGSNPSINLISLEKFLTP